ncbi:MAG: hypothetical protein NVS2B3_05510 [Vulcanimicrobiaceae bacterium]
MSIPVTVLVPAFNAAAHLPIAIATVRAQSVEVEEIVVVDDGSSDDSVAVAEALGARVIRRDHGGPAAARNAGLAAAKTPWIATLDADDVWHPRKLEYQYAAIGAHPHVGLVFSDFDAVSLCDGSIQAPSVVSGDLAFARIRRTALTETASLLDFADFLHELPARSIVLPSTAFFSRALALEVGGFAIGVVAEDTEFFLRLAARTRTAYVDLPLLAYMRHPTQITANWQLDPVRIALYHHVMRNRSRYHDLVIRGYRERYARLLYYLGAYAVHDHQFAHALVLVAKALAIAIARGGVPDLCHTIAASAAVAELVRRLRLADDHPYRPAGSTLHVLPKVGSVAIPWRQVATPS